MIALLPLLLLFLLLLCSDTASSSNSAVLDSPPDQEPDTPLVRDPSAMEAATAMNSIAFLRELVGRKSTSDEVFYQEEDTTWDKDGDGGGGGDAEEVGRWYGGNAPPRPERRGDRGDGGESPPPPPCNGRRVANTCEYTGRLWFMKGSGGIRFRETVRICDDGDGGDGVPSGDAGRGSSVAVECLTRYRHKDSWFDCSKVVCRFTMPPSSLSSSSSTGDGEGTSKGRRKPITGVTATTAIADAPLVMHMDSEILLRAPLFGISGAVKEKITRTFGSAARDFYDKIYKRVDV